MKTQEIVKFQNIHKSYFLGEIEIKALSGISFSVKKEKFTFIVGKSGSGKSTLLNLIGAIDSPTSGKITINDVAIDILNDDDLSDFRAKHIGHIFQNFNLMPLLNVYENIEYPLLMINEKKETISQMKDKYKTTFIFVTHDRDILDVADETYLLSDGRLEKQVGIDYRRYEW